MQSGRLREMLLSWRTPETTYSVHSYTRKTYVCGFFGDLSQLMSLTAFKCTYPECEKLFNRHDNLLQHLKVHKEMKRTRESSSGLSNDTDQEDHVDDTATSSRIASVPVSPPVTPSQPLRFPDLYKPATTVIHPTASSHLPTTIISYTSIASYTASTPVLSSEPLGFSTNMAVSSIRTEIPSSPLLRNSSKTMIE